MSYRKPFSLPAHIFSDIGTHGIESVNKNQESVLRLLLMGLSVHAGLQSVCLLVSHNGSTLTIGRIRKYSIPVISSCHCLQFTTQCVAECNFKYRQTCIERFCQFQITLIMQNSPTFVFWIKFEIPFHSLSRENFFKECFVIFHICRIFVSQSRAFLSQLSVTGDESGFFMSAHKYIIFSSTTLFSSPFLHITFLPSDLVSAIIHCREIPRQKNIRTKNR